MLLLWTVLMGMVIGDPFGSPNSGITFKPIGGIEHSGHHYYVLFEIDVHGLMAAIEPIKRSIIKVQGNLKANLQMLNSLKPLRANWVIVEDQPVRAEDREKDPSLTIPQDSKLNYVTTALTDSIQDHITFITEDILERQRELENYLLAIGQHISHESEDNKILRARRALCDGCGQAISWIFGLTTDSELRDTNEALERLSKLGEDTRKMVNLHTTILNSSSIHMAKISKQVNRITNLLYTVNEQVSLIGRHVENTDQIQFTVINSVTLLSSLSYASEALGELRGRFINLKLGIDQMRGGYLNTGLVPPQTLLTIIQEIINQNLKSLWPATTDYIVQMYRYISVKSLPHNNLSFVIQIPLEGIPSIRLNLYKIIQIPHPLDTKLVIHYTELPRYFSISDDHSLFTEQQTLSSCRNYEDLFVCPIDNPLYTAEVSSCTLALFKGITNTEICIKHFGPALTRPLVKRTDLGWMYSTSFNIKVTLICPDSTTIVNLPVGSGVLNMPDQCRASSQYFIIPSSVNTHGKNIVTNISIVSPFKLRLTNVEWEDITLLNNSKIGLELIKINNDKLPLKGLKDKISQLKYLKSQQKISMVTSNSGLTIGIICLILIAIIFVVIYLFIRTARNQINNNREGNANRIGDNTMAESLLAEYQRRRRARQLQRVERQLDSEDNVPLEDVSNTDTVERYDRRLHSSPNSPVPLPRERSHTLVSTLSIPRVSIVTPDACRYETRPDSL